MSGVGDTVVIVRVETERSIGATTRVLLEVRADGSLVAMGWRRVGKSMVGLRIEQRAASFSRFKVWKRGEIFKKAPPKK